MRALYTLLVYLALPLLPLRLMWRARKEPEYRDHIAERYGIYKTDAPSPVLWLHAVSLGETRAAAPLVEKILNAYPDTTLLLTHMTATGRAAGRSLFGDRVIQAWLPYDAPFAVRSFLAHFEPIAGLIMETELWPNLIALSRKRGTPLYLVNARMSERSQAGYAKVATFTRSMLTSLSGIAAQTESDAQRLAALGAQRPVVTGNLKFDVGASSVAETLGREFRQRFGTTRAIFVVGATRDGEEALILDALGDYPLPPGTLTVIVPRHPQRFDDVADLLRKRGIGFVRRSSEEAVTADVAVVLGDSMGEMRGYYAAADVVFVGGGLLPFGGQNLIEPIAAGRPTLVGSHMFNFAEATATALAAGAAIQVNDASELVATVRSLLADSKRRQALSDAARSFHAAHRGAADRLWNWLAPQLAERIRRPSTLD